MWSFIEKVCQPEVWVQRSSPFVCPIITLCVLSLLLNPMSAYSNRSFWCSFQRMWQHVMQLSSFRTHLWPQPLLHAVFSCHLTNLKFSANVSSLFKSILTYSSPLKFFFSRYKNCALLILFLYLPKDKYTYPFTVSFLNHFLAFCSFSNKISPYRLLTS